MPHPLRFESKKGRICVAWVWNWEGTEKLVNGKQHSVWFVPTGMKGLRTSNRTPQFSVGISERWPYHLSIYLPSGISEIFCQMVSTFISFRSISFRFAPFCFANYTKPNRALYIHLVAPQTRNNSTKSGNQDLKTAFDTQASMVIILL